MSIFGEVWAHMAETKLPFLSLGDAITAEFACAIGLLPLAVVDMRLEVEGVPFASDASLSGGAFCRGSTLTDLGRASAREEIGKLRDPPVKGLILVTCGADVCGTAFGSTLVGLEITARYHWGAANG